MVVFEGHIYFIKWGLLTVVMSTEIVLGTQKVTLKVWRLGLLKSKLSETSIGKSMNFRL